MVKKTVLCEKEADLLCFLKKSLTFKIIRAILFKRVIRNNYARTAMMQEIASKDGNFCGVCPVIGRLR